MTEQELLRLKKKVDDAKTNIATLNGQVQVHENQLKDVWGHKTISDAKKDVLLRDKKIEQYDTQIEKGLEKLEKYNLESEE